MDLLEKSFHVLALAADHCDRIVVMRDRKASGDYARGELDDSSVLHSRTVASTVLTLSVASS